MTVAEMRARMSNAEWTDWRIYYIRRNEREEREMAKAKRGRR